MRNSGGNMLPAVLSEWNYCVEFLQWFYFHHDLNVIKQNLVPVETQPYTRLRAKSNILVAGASPTHINFRSRCCDCVWYLFQHELRLLMQPTRYVGCLCNRCGILHTKLLMQLSMQNTTSMRFLQVPANWGFFIQKWRCRCYYWIGWVMNASHSPLVQFV